MSQFKRLGLYSCLHLDFYSRIKWSCGLLGGKEDCTDLYLNSKPPLLPSLPF